MSPTGRLEPVTLQDSLPHSGRSLTSASGTTLPVYDWRLHNVNRSECIDTFAYLFGAHFQPLSLVNTLPEPAKRMVRSGAATG
jgi:hypothetical protein